MEKGLIIGAVMLAVSVIIIGSLLVPIIDDAVDDSEVKYNNNSNFYSVILSGDEGSITGSIDSEGVLTINGDVLTNTTQRYAIMGNTFYLRYSGTAHTFNYWDAENNQMANVSHIPASFTASNGSITYTDESVEPATSVTVSYDWMAYNTAAESNYREIVATGTAKTIYINEKTDVYAVSKLTGTNGLFSIAAGQFSQTDEADNGSLVFDTHEINNVDGIEYFMLSTTAADSDLKYNYTVSDEETTGFSGNIIVPYEVDGVKDPPGRAYGAILIAIPPIVIVSLILAALGFVMYRMRD